MIHALEMGFTFENRRNKLIISVAIRVAAKDIRNSMVYTALSISTCKIKSLYTDIRGILTYESSLLIYQLNMIHLKFVAKMNKQLCNAQGTIISSTALFSDPPLIILINDFYQLAFINSYGFWDRPYSKKKSMRNFY